MRYQLSKNLKAETPAPGLSGNVTVVPWEVWRKVTGMLYATVISPKSGNFFG
jgi:hypothetical protein